jgi:hypothetical protein
LKQKLLNQSEAKNLKRKKAKKSEKKLKKAKKSEKSEKSEKKVKKCEKSGKIYLNFASLCYASKRFALFRFEAKITKSKRSEKFKA